LGDGGATCFFDIPWGIGYVYRGVRLKCNKRGHPVEKGGVNGRRTFTQSCGTQSRPQRGTRKQSQNSLYTIGNKGGGKGQNPKLKFGVKWVAQATVENRQETRGRIRHRVQDGRYGDVRACCSGKSSVGQSSTEVILPRVDTSPSA